MAATLNMQSQVLQDIGRYDEAIERQEASLAMKRERGDEEGQAISLHQLSMLYMLKEDYPAALARSGEAEALDRKLGDQAGLAADLHEQGLVYNRMARAAASDAEAGRYRQAAFDRFTEILAISRRIGDEAGAADSLTELARILMGSERYREAIEFINEGLEIRERLGLKAKIGISLEFLGSVHERQGQLAAALEKYGQALELFKRYSHAADVADTERHIARVRGKLGR